jgi:putative toxin-antitoxin system antitoxin component (TIGR02293 family)
MTDMIMAKKQSSKRSKSTPATLAAEDAGVYHPTYALIGIHPYKSEADLITLIRTGLPNTVLQKLKVLMDISADELAAIMHISTRTLLRKEADKKPLNSEQTERVIELARLYAKGEEVTGSKAAFKEWMDTKVDSLGQKRPKDYLDTSLGIQMLLDELGRIEYGIYS